MNFGPGDAVRITDREATPHDLKTGLFYDHLRGLAGSVLRVFDSGEVAVELELDGLPEAVWKRHMTVRDQMRARWLEGLPEDSRRRLRPEHKEFNLRYVALVAAGDLVRPRAARKPRA